MPIEFGFFFLPNTRPRYRIVLTFESFKHPGYRRIPIVIRNFDEQYETSLIGNELHNQLNEDPVRMATHYNHIVCAMAIISLLLDKNKRNRMPYQRRYIMIVCRAVIFLCY